MANGKKTQKDLFEELKAYVKDNVELTEFLDKKIEQVSRKSKGGELTATQKENLVIKDVILEVLNENDKPMTVVDIQAKNENLQGLSNQKMSALLTQLVNGGNVVRTVDKRKAYFSIAR